MCVDLIEGGENGAAICINEGEPGRAENEEQGPAAPCPKVLQQQSSHSHTRSETEVFFLQFRYSSASFQADPI